MIGTRFLDPKNDVAFKKIFGSEKHKDILIAFLNDILGFKNRNQIQEATFLSTIQDPEIASKKQSIVDVLCQDQEGKQYIIEMQVQPSEGFVKRAQYYAAKAYCRQLNKGQEIDGRYINLKEIIFIAISGSTIFNNKEDYFSTHVILDDKTYARDLKDFSFTFIELSKFKKKEVSELENIIEKWCYFFKYAPQTNKQELQEIMQSNNAAIVKAYDALDQFNWSEAELMSYEREIKRVMDNRGVLAQQIQDATEEIAAKAAEAEARAKKAEEQIARAEEQIARAEEQTARAEEQTARAEEQTKLAYAEIEKSKAEIENAKVEAEKFSQEALLLKAQKEKNQINIVEKMLKKGLSIEEIEEITSLEQHQILAIKNQNERKVTA